MRWRTSGAGLVNPWCAASGHAGGRQLGGSRRGSRLAQALQLIWTHAPHKHSPTHLGWRLEGVVPRMIDVSWFLQARRAFSPAQEKWREQWPADSRRWRRRGWGVLTARRVAPAAEISSCLQQIAGAGMLGRERRRYRAASKRVRRRCGPRGHGMRNADSFGTACGSGQPHGTL